MNVYIVQDAGEVSGNYHSDGGLTVIAKDLEQAKTLATAAGAKLTDEEWATAVVHQLRYSRGVEPKAFIFPNAGCC